MRLIIELIRWYWQNTVHKYHVARGMYAAIKGLDPRTPNPPEWRVTGYFWDCALRDGDGHETEELERMKKELWKRLWIHDLSKYTWKEARWFVKENWRLRKLTYGSPEYKAAIDRIRPGIQAHYEANRHHPEWHENGLLGMSLIDEIEMICDWAAATRKHDDGNILISIEKNAERFGYEGDKARIDFYEKLARTCFTTHEWSKILDGSILHHLSLVGMSTTSVSKPSEE